MDNGGNNDGGDSGNNGDSGTPDKWRINTTEKVAIEARIVDKVSEKE